MPDRGRRTPPPFMRGSTLRLAVLGAVFVLLAVMLVPTLRAYLGQQQELSATRQEVVDREQSVRDLQARKKQWDDPAFVEQQARERLKYVRPGEKAYHVVGAENLLGDPLAGHGTVVDPGKGDDRLTWYDRVWSSMQMADRTDIDRNTTPLTPVGVDPAPERDGATSAPAEQTSGVATPTQDGTPAATQGTGAASTAPTADDTPTTTSTSDTRTNER